jgi:hypothetical protein
VRRYDVVGVPVRVSPAWLMLREPADAAARSTELPARIGWSPVSAAPAVVHDLGCGSGAMGRWLAPLLPGAQHWVLHDRDPALLERALQDPPAGAADGAPVTVETRRSDITMLDSDDLAGAALVTASALLDMMTEEELERFVRTCTSAGCPVLVALSVVGRVDLEPADPLDEDLLAAFNAHQRRTDGGRTLLGPDAVEVASRLFGRYGAEVIVRPSPWRLGAADTALTGEWLTGWLDAACEQRPELSAAAAAYRRRRQAELGSGDLHVTVHHQDLLALPDTHDRPR